MAPPLSRKVKRTLSLGGSYLAGSAHRGYCPICERNTTFVERGRWLRDEYHCARCHSIPRWRALMHVLAQTFPDWRTQSIHECSPGGPLSDKLRRECAGYVPTHYFHGEQPGSTVRGFRCEDLMAQTFPDACFDLVITSDVFEHIPDVEAASREIIRTLKPGGAHVFTVPWFRAKPTLVRAIVREGQVVHLAPPDYHGNPIDAQGALVFTEWGREFPFLSAQWTGVPLIIHCIKDRSLGLDGEFLEVFIQQKPQ